MKAAGTTLAPWLEILQAVRLLRQQLDATVAGQRTGVVLRIRTVADFHRAPRRIQ